jgi:hypothetical protein
MRSGRTLAQASFTSQDPERARPSTPTALTGSVTETFTGTLLADMVARGEGGTA